MRRLLTVALLAPALALVPAPARAQAPDAVGWWSAAHRSAVPVAPPAPPDVAAGDLLLQGGDVQRELPDTPPAPTAYAALRYAVPDGGTVERLTLKVATGAQAADVRAYATTASWQPAENGAIEDAPAPDLSRYAVASLTTDGTALVFEDIGKLATDDGLLSVVLVPGVSDRVVVLPPTADALTVSDPPATSDVPPPPVVVVTPPPAAVVPVTAPLPPVLAPVTPALPVTPPLVPATASPAPQLPAQPISAASTRRTVVADDDRARVVVLLEVLLLTVFFGLLGTGPLARLARLTGEQVTATPERGLGRFRAAREGRAPRL